MADPLPNPATPEEAPPSWSGITSDPRWAAATPQKQLDIFDKWHAAALTHASKDPNWPSYQDHFTEQAAATRAGLTQAAPPPAPGTSDSGISDAISDYAKAEGSEADRMQKVSEAEAAIHKHISNQPWDSPLNEKQMTRDALAPLPKDIRDTYYQHTAASQQSLSDAVASKILQTGASIAGGVAEGGAVMAGIAGQPNPQGQFNPPTHTQPSQADLMTKVQNDPLFKWGKQLSEDTARNYPIDPRREGALGVKAAGLATGFLPAIAGPAAPIVFAGQALGETVSSQYDAQIKSGTPPEEAAQSAFQHGLVSGGLQGLVWAVLPPALRSTFDKLLIDKFGTTFLTRWLTGRVAAAGEGLVLGAASRISQNVGEGKPLTEGVKESAGTLGLIQAVLPHGATAREVEVRAQAHEAALAENIRAAHVDRVNALQDAARDARLSGGSPKTAEELDNLAQQPSPGEPLPVAAPARVDLTHDLQPAAGLPEAKEPAPAEPGEPVKEPAPIPFAELPGKPDGTRGVDRNGQVYEVKNGAIHKVVEPEPAPAASEEPVPAAQERMTRVEETKFNNQLANLKKDPGSTVENKLREMQKQLQNSPQDATRDHKLEKIAQRLGESAPAAAPELAAPALPEPKFTPNPEQVRINTERNTQEAEQLGLKNTKDPIGTALNAIISNPSTPPRLVILAKHLMTALGDTTSNVQVNLVTDYAKAKGSAGSYFPHPTDPTRGIVSINMGGGQKGGVTQSLLHELVHHVILRKLDPGYKLAPDEAEAVARLTKIYDHVKSTTHNPDAYHLSNLDEFVTHLLTDSTTQASLHAIDLPAELKQPGQKSILDALFSALRRLFGVKKEGGALEEALKQAGILTSTLPEADRIDPAKARQFKQDLSEGVKFAEPKPKVPAPPSGERIVIVQKPDGTTYPASFADKFWDIGGEKTAAVAKLTPEGEWSHGMLEPGEKIMEPAAQPEPKVQAEEDPESAEHAGKFTGVMRDGKIADYQLELNPDAGSKALAALQARLTKLAGEGKLTPAEAARMGQQVLDAAERVSRLMFSNQNAVIDEQRRVAGKAPLAKSAAQAFGPWWAEAEKQFTGDPSIANTLMEDFTKHPRGATPVEGAILLMRQIDLHHRIAKASRDLDAATPEDRAEARAKFTALQEAYDHVQEVMRITGEEGGRAQVARKMMAAEDYTLAKMLNEKRVIAGDPKTPAEREAQEAFVKKHNTEIAKNMQAEADHQASSDRVVKPSKTKETATSEQVAAKIHARIFEAGAPLESLGHLIQRLAKAFVQEGITDRDKLIDSVHAVLTKYDPTLERNETMNAISGYGKWRPLTKDVVSKTLRDLQGQMQQLGKLFTMEDESKAPLKTGTERRIPTEAEEALIAKVRAKLRSGGFETTDDEFRLKSGLELLKERLQKRIADYQARLEQKDFAPKAKPEPIGLDPEADRLAAATLKSQRDWKRALLADQAAKRPGYEKALDNFAKFSRFAKLSAISTLIKLTAFAGYRAVQIPLEDAIGAGLGAIPGPLKQVFDKASIEGGFSVSAYAKGYAEAITTGMVDAYDMATTGHSTLQTLYGDKVTLPAVWLDFFGTLHGALKSPTLRGSFTVGLEKQISHAMQHGVDVTDPNVMTGLMMDTFKRSSAKYAYRQILLQDNVLSDMWNQAIARLQAKDKTTGRISLNRKLGATAMKATIPIVKVPLNFVTEVLVHATGTASGTAKLAGAMRRGMENLTADEADIIARHLKKGLLGFAVLALGYFNPAPTFIEAGGYYQSGEKRKPGEVGAGRLRIGGWDVPPYLSHTPILELLQLGATVRRVHDSYISATDRRKHGFTAAIGAGAIGLARETPFMETMLDVDKLTKDPGGWAGDYMRGIVVPQAVQNIAGWADLQPDVQKNYVQRWLKDQTVRRQAKTPLEHIEKGIPGLRQTLKKSENQNP